MAYTRVPNIIVPQIRILTLLTSSALFILFIYIAVQPTLHDRRFMAALCGGEEVTVHSTGISLLLSTSVRVLSSLPIER